MATVTSSRRTFEKTLRSAKTTMVFSETFRLAIDSFRASKVRFMLTMLGMIIGSASIILVVTVGLTGKQYALNMISSIGPNMIEMQYNGGNVTVTNSATVNGSSAAIDATTTSGGVVTIDNFGTIVGSVLSAGVTFHNELGALWYLAGNSTFATVTDALINDGTINVLSGSLDVAAAVSGNGTSIRSTKAEAERSEDGQGETDCERDAGIVAGAHERDAEGCED